MNKNFQSILWITGHFGCISRESVQSLVYRGEFNQISANRTLAKLVNEHRLLKRIIRGRGKTDAYKLSGEGIKFFKRNFGYEPKVFSSLDKLSHSLQILNFYIVIIKDMINRKLIKDDYIIIEEKNKINFLVHKNLEFVEKDKIKLVISDGFCIYRYSNKGIVFYLEIENSDRTSSNIAIKTIKNYEGYYKSAKWMQEEWQPKGNKIFPPILIVCFSEWKVNDLIRNFNKRINLPINYFFTDYNSLEKQGFSGPIWSNINGEKMFLIK